MKRASDFSEKLENMTSKNPFNAKDANPANEDEYMRRCEELYNKRKNIPPQPPKPDIPDLSAMQRDVSSWSESDLDEVMKSSGYQNNASTQNKVKSYFDFKYPGKQKVGATGRPY